MFAADNTNIGKKVPYRTGTQVLIVSVSLFNFFLYFRSITYKFFNSEKRKQILDYLRTIVTVLGYRYTTYPYLLSKWVIQAAGTNVGSGRQVRYRTINVGNTGGGYLQMLVVVGTVPYHTGMLACPRSAYFTGYPNFLRTYMVLATVLSYFSVQVGTGTYLKIPKS